MLNKKYFSYRSFLMLIRVKLGSDGLNIKIPISLMVIDQTFDALEDLAWLWENLFFKWFVREHLRRHPRFGNFFTGNNFGSAPRQMLVLCRELINELRSYGRWRMVEVEIKNPKSPIYRRHGDEVRVYIDFI